MNNSIQKKKDDFSKKIRSQQKQAYFQRQRRKLFDAQQQGDIDLQHLIIAQLIDEFGTQEQVRKMLAEYEEYEKSVEEYERKVEEDEEASMNFQRLQEQQQLQQARRELEELFEEMEKEEREERENKQRDIEI